MIPYFPQPSLSIGPYTAHAWGLMVFLGLMLGMNRAEHRIRRFGGNVEAVSSLAVWAFVCGMLFGHVFESVVYHPQEFFADPSRVLNLTTGYSSFGGFLGGWFTTWFLCRRRGLDYRIYGESIVYGLTLGWILGRLGCFLAHDHIGAPTDFFLAVDFPARLGGPSHDLGLYEMLLTLVLAGIWTFRERDLEKVGVVPWQNTAIVVMLYAPARYFFDSLRVGEELYLGRTVGQWSSVGAFLGGLALFVASRRFARVHPAPPAPGDDAAGGSSAESGDAAAPSAG